MNGKTPAIRFLQQHRIDFSEIAYAYREEERKGKKDAREKVETASLSVGLPLSQTVKTLVAEMDEKKPVLVLVPGDRKLNFKKLAKACNVKKASLMSPEKAERLTGYRVGGISPFGVKNPVAAIMDKNVLMHEKIAINGGKRGLMLILDPKHIYGILNCTSGDVSEDIEKGKE